MRRAKEKKGNEAQRVKHPTREIDELIGNEEQNERQKKERTKERKREWVPNSVALDNLVTSYDPHGSYSGAILKPCIYIYGVRGVWVHWLGVLGARDCVTLVVRECI